MTGAEQRVYHGLLNEEVGEQLETLFSRIDSGELCPGFSTRVYNLLGRSGRFCGFSFSDLRGVLGTASWEESFAGIGGLAGMGIGEIQALANFFQFVDANFPEGVPLETFKIKAEGNHLLIDNLPARPFLPIFWEGFRSRAVFALTKKIPLVLVRKEEMEKAKEEAVFLRKYFGLELGLKAEEEHYEENLNHCLQLGREMFQQLDFAPRASSRFSNLAESLGFFAFFFIQNNDKFLSPEEIEIRNRVGIATLQTYIELVLGINEILPGENRRRSLFKGWVGGKKTPEQLTDDYQVTRERIRKVLSDRIKQINELLYGSTKNRLNYHSLPVDWPRREIFFTDEKTAVDLVDGRVVPVWSLIKDCNQKELRIALVEEGQKKLVVAINIPPADTVPLESRSAAYFRAHKWPTLTKILKGVREEEWAIKLRSGWGKGFDANLIKYLEENGVKVYKAKSGGKKPGGGFSYYIDPQNEETAKDLIRNFYSPS